MKSTTWLTALRACNEMGREQTEILEGALRADDRDAIEATVQRLATIRKVLDQMGTAMAKRCDGYIGKDGEAWVEEKYLELAVGMTSDDIDLYGDGPKGPRIRRNSGEYTTD